MEAATHVAQAWARIEHWLAQNAPAVLGGLRPGASDTDIDATESTLKVLFPDDLRAFLRRHDGQDPEAATLLPEGQLLALDDIRDRWSFQQELLDAQEPIMASGSEPDPGVRADWWNPGWIPLTDDLSSDYLCCDLNPGPGGVRGQVIAFWHDSPERPVRWPSITAWLTAVADGLESGHLIYDPDGWGGIREQDTEHEP